MRSAGDSSPPLKIIEAHFKGAQSLAAFKLRVQGARGEQHDRSQCPKPGDFVGLGPLAEYTGRSQEDIRGTYDELRKLRKSSDKLWKKWPWSRLDVSLDAWDLLRLATLLGSAQEIWKAYAYVDNALRAKGLETLEDPMKSDILRVFEQALELPSEKTLERFTDHTLFDDDGGIRLEPERDAQGQQVANVDFCIRKDESRTMDEQLQELRFWAEEHGAQLAWHRASGHKIFIDVRIKVPTAIDFTELHPLLRSLQAMAPDHVWDWVSGREQ